MQNATEESRVDLSAPYEPVALYYDDADAIEYLRRAAVCYYRRIDGFLTLAFDMENNELLGFRLKGFKNFYLNYLANTDRNTDFLELVKVVERVVQVLAETFLDDISRDPARQEAYDAAHRIAAEDRVELRDLPRAA